MNQEHMYTYDGNEHVYVNHWQNSNTALDKISESLNKQSLTAAEQSSGASVADRIRLALPT